jgi:MFS family permease
MTGLSGGIFWCTEGSIAMGYPQKDKVGFYLALWLAFRNSGSVIGSAINFGLNHNPSAVSSLSSSTYIVFIVLQCIGPFVGLLLSEPGKVIRPDGTSPDIHNKITIKAELSAIHQRVLKDWRIIILIPLMLYLTWFQSYT